VRVEEIDATTASDELLRELHDVEVESTAELTAGEPPRSLEVSLGFYRNPGDGRRRRWLAFDGAQKVGTSTLSIYAPTFVYAQVAVRPSHRRRGVGTMLYERVLAAAREEELASFFSHHATPAGAAFASRSGGRDDQREVRALLDLRTADLPAPHVPDGVELVTWIGATPDDLLESYVRARQAMADAPVPGGFESPEWTVEKQLAIEDAAMKRGRPPHVTVALENGDVVAFTELRVSTPPSPVVGTDDTATVPSARRRGLARAVKLESLRRLRDERPDVELVNTLNAEHNLAMRHINTQIGFVPTVTLTTTVVTL
jgi:GNAT superfamily N-acetyltransferase